MGKPGISTERGGKRGPAVSVRKRLPEKSTDVHRAVFIVLDTFSLLSSNKDRHLDKIGIDRDILSPRRASTASSGAPRGHHDTNSL